ncbi:MAG: thioredoxin family protein [Roseivirga sp.]|nr:thioredoxin family protein [Roseivirga sp.]
MKQFITIIKLCLLLGTSPALAQDYAISFETLDSLQKQSPKPVVVFLHADWCKFCANMKNTTFQNEEVKALLSDQFYFVSFDGESKEDVKLLGNTFRYKPTGANTGVHELAEQLGTKDGTLSYPTVTFLNAKYEILYQHDSFISGKKLKKTLSRLLKSVDTSRSN